MDQQTKEKTLENLTKSENILVICAKDVGFDGIAAGLALFLSLSKLGKNVRVLAQNPTAGDAQRLYAVDKIGKVGGAKNPVIVIKDAVATVDKVTYFLDQDKLKVIIHPLPGSKGVTPDQISTEYTTSQPNLIFAIGFESPSALENEIPHEHKITPEIWIVSITRQQLQQKFAQHEYFNPQSNSISEVAASVIQDLALPLDEDIAYNLYTGISDSTNNFNPAMTTSRTFEIASWLVKFGAGKASLAEFRPASFANRQDQENIAATHQPTPAAGLFGPNFRQTFPNLAPHQQVSQNQFPSVPKPQIPRVPFNPQDIYDEAPPMEEVESLPESKSQEADSKDWLKPPKIYKGSKSFGENKG